MIEINKLCKTYNAQPVLHNLSLSITEGDFVILVGANGAGKTTFLRILATLTRPNSGSVTIDGSSLFENPSLRQMIGYLGHHSLFYGDLTARENLLHYAHLYQLENPKGIIQKAIESAGLVPHQSKAVRTYSRGMQQRLAIERALLHDPSLLLLDEPYTGLDQETAENLDNRLGQLHAQGKIILAVAHRPQRLLKIATNIAWLQEGQINQKAPVETLTDFPDLLQYIREVK